MPQMSPINWLSLFFIFSFTFIMFNLLNYFSLNPSKIDNKTSGANNSNKYFNWKW